MTWPGVVGAVALWTVLHRTLPGLLRLLARGGLVRPNFRGVYIPVSAGVFPALGAALACALLGALGHPAGYVTALALTAVAAVGLLDDAAGDRRVRGLSGHVGALLRGELSTGALKALLIPAVGVVAGLSLGRGFVWGVVDGLTAALAANTANLLDVRPGRALKGVALLLALAAAPAWRTPVIDLLLVVVAALVVYAPYDLRGAAMLGDSGANAFGFAGGWLCVLAFGPAARLLLLILLAGLHVLAERRSLTAVIEGVPILKALDRWGRG